MASEVHAGAGFTVRQNREPPSKPTNDCELGLWRKIRQPEGEGWKWRGREPLQLTFFDNYKACSKGIGIDLLTEPDVVFEPAVGALTAAWYFKKAGCNALADDGDFIEITQRVNGGQINADKRMALYVSAKNAFGV